RSRVPVKLPHYPRLKSHGDAGDTLRNRQLGDRRLLPEAVGDNLSLRLLESKLERRQFLIREKRIRDVVHEARIAGNGRLRCCQGCRGESCAYHQNVSPGNIEHGRHARSPFLASAEMGGTKAATGSICATSPTNTTGPGSISKRPGPS